MSNGHEVLLLGGDRDGSRVRIFHELTKAIQFAPASRELVARMGIPSIEPGPGPSTYQCLFAEVPDSPVPGIPSLHFTIPVYRHESLTEQEARNKLAEWYTRHGMLNMVRDDGSFVFELAK